VLKNEVVNYGSADLFNKLLAESKQTADASFKSDIAAALTGTKDPALIAELIKKFEDADTIKPQDLRAWFRGVLANSAGEQAAWDWIRNDWQWLEDTVGGDMEFTTYITVVASVFRTAERLAEFKAFFEPKVNVPGLGREITMDTKVITSRVELVEAEQAAVNAAVAAEVK
jgi:aminopeptidase N